MKDFIDEYGNAGKKCSDGTLRITAHYQTHGTKTGKLEYVRLENHNGKTVSIRVDKIKEIIEILSYYNLHRE